MLKQSTFLLHRGINIVAGSIIICGRCEMPIWRMTGWLAGLRKYTGYRGIPIEFITLLDGSPPKRPNLFYKGEPCWECPECGKYIVTNGAVFFETPPTLWTLGYPGRKGILRDPSMGHRLRFFIDYERG